MQKVRPIPFVMSRLKSAFFNIQRIEFNKQTGYNMLDGGCSFSDRGARRQPPRSAPRSPRLRDAPEEGVPYKENDPRKMR